ncbi:uncharacterized protein LOC122054164 [Zingiber officinale]|uniref:uncharacterized protein LOC122054164 n=1 Tax=Zingiber officinale TaxID=94328 RepID=UPI001C4D51D5|nr:uncharacterized protein LOC122054164 [Zingiber officinale]
MGRSLELLSVLLVVMLAVWPPPAAEALPRWPTFCRGEARWLCLRPPRIGMPPPPSAKQCMAPIRPVKGCVHSLFRSDTSGKLQVEGDCCGAVRSMEGQCFDAVFTSFYFSSDFAPKLKEHCTPPATD